MSLFTVRGAVGNTPLIRLNKISNLLKRNVFAKAEFMNPGGSIKDRCAMYIIDDAEKKGLIKPGGTLIEATAGNTGIGLLLLALSKGYKCLFYIPENISQSKCDILTNMGATVKRTPMVPESDPLFFTNQCVTATAQIENSFYTNQFENLSNFQSHLETTGPEIYRQLDGEVDLLVCASGSGGTILGTSTFLKSKIPGIKVVLADRPGSVNYSYVQTKGQQLEDIEGQTSIVEGVGKPSITGNLKQVIDTIVDDSIKIDDLTTVTNVLQVLSDEGLFIGGSSGLNVSAAIEVAKTMPEGSNIVTVLPDSGQKYIEKIFSQKFLTQIDLFDQIPDHLKRFTA